MSWRIFGCDFVTSKLRDQVRTQLESTGNGRFCWKEASGFLKGSQKISTHTPFLILTQREKRLDSCTPKHTTLKVLFLRKPEVIEIPHHPYMICSKIIQINWV